MILVILGVVLVLLILCGNYKRNAVKFLLFFAIILVIFAVISHTNRYAYPTGRDTREAFGNGAYQLLSGPEHLSLYNEKYGEIIIARADAYLKKGELVYITGAYHVSGDETEIYAVIDTKNNFLTICIEPTVLQYIRFHFDELINNREAEILSEFSEFPEDIQTVFRSMHAVGGDS